MANHARPGYTNAVVLPLPEGTDQCRDSGNQKCLPIPVTVPRVVAAAQKAQACDGRIAPDLVLLVERQGYPALSQPLSLLPAFATTS